MADTRQEIVKIPRRQGQEATGDRVRLLLLDYCDRGRDRGRVYGFLFVTVFCHKSQSRCQRERVMNPSRHKC
jgi:hypothetical protein